MTESSGPFHGKWRRWKEKSIRDDSSRTGKALTSWQTRESDGCVGDDGASERGGGHGGDDGGGGGHGGDDSGGDSGGRDVVVVTWQVIHDQCSVLSE